MMKSPLMRLGMMISWGVTAVFSANLLFAKYGFDIIGRISMMVPGMAQSLVWIIGLCGIYSLAMFVMALTGCSACGCDGSYGSKCPRCGCSPCMCK